MLSFGIGSEADAVDHRLHVRPVHDRIGEFAKPRLALNQQNGQAELHTELGLQVVLWMMMNQSVGEVMIRAHFHEINILSLDLFGANEPFHLGHTGMRQ